MTGGCSCNRLVARQRPWRPRRRRDTGKHARVVIKHRAKTNEYENGRFLANNILEGLPPSKKSRLSGEKRLRFTQDRYCSFVPDVRNTFSKRIVTMRYVETFTTKIVNRYIKKSPDANCSMNRI